MMCKKPMIYGKRLLVGWSAILLASCQTMDLKEKSEFCDIARPIWWSRKDTLETIKQVKVHNAVGKMCGWGNANGSYTLGSAMRVVR